MDFKGKRATIMGLGRFGGAVAAAEWLARQGAIVTVTDLKDEAALADSLAALEEVPIAHLHLGGHCEEDFSRTNLLVVNPAVRPGNRFVQIARDSGARLTTEIALVIDRCPVPVIGVTGSNGKSTTAAMIAAILRADGPRCWLGGNLGGSLLEKLQWMEPGDWTVLELSSFQLWRLGSNTPMPHISVVTGCTPNHLDWHRDYAEYVAAKQRILLQQTEDDLAVLNTLDREVALWEPLVRGRRVPLPSLEEIPALKVPGEHNRINAACAAAAAQGVGCTWDAIRHGLSEFDGLPQRLEQFAAIEGRRFYNDSTSTTPESTMAALRSLDGPVWLLVGGKDKGTDFGDLAATLAERAAGAAFFGSVRDVLQGSASARDLQFPCTATETMGDALRWCWECSAPGDAIVLSPGFASADQFDNFRIRGNEFVRLVKALT